MNIDDFRGFYQAVHGYEPFTWQKQLLRTVAEQGWPEAIALPTSSGKTSAIDIAVFHLALEAGLSLEKRTAPLRTFFVIDRRVVVDEAYGHATKIARALASTKHGILADVAQALSCYGGQVPLQISMMRGGMFRDNSWADEPNQPLVNVSTVDQIGSRLLFRGYQVGDSSRPVHAGLIGNDSLIILDEAHLSKAFLGTLDEIRTRYMQWADKAPSKPFCLVQMSATTTASTPFGLKTNEVELDEPLRARLSAAKPAELIAPGKAFEAELAVAARKLAKEPGVSVVGVVVNTIGTARTVFESLQQKAEAVLLIGRNRPYCAEELWNQYGDRIAAKPDRAPGPLLYVVATQTVEVGANIDFDVLVTESAPLDALRQRFGRLNRLGRKGVAKAAIVLRPKGDPVYGAPTEETWKFLKERAPVDFGVSAMETLLDGLKAEDLAAMNTASSPGPLLFPTHLELWVQTNPAPRPDPEVAPFLHGEKALEAADVQVVWREDLVGQDPEQWKTIVALAPPLAAEALPLPLAAVRQWLRNQDQEITDVEGVAIAEEKGAKGPRDKNPGRLALRWRGTEKSEVVTSGAVRPGDTLIVPADYDGADKYGWNVHFAETRDIGDDANNKAARLGLRRPRIRLALLSEEDRKRVNELINRYRGDDEQPGDQEIKNEISGFFKFKGEFKVDAETEVITWDFQAKPDESTSSSEETGEDDESSLIGERIRLTVHTSGVEKRARRYAQGCGLSDDLIEDIATAARWHDLGKCDDRFQSWLHGGPHFGEYLAKSGTRRTPAEEKRIRQSARYPEGARHEAASALGACTLGLLAGAHDADLVMYLIGTHHGYGRPFFPVWDEDPTYRISVEMDGVAGEITSGHGLGRIDSGWMERFWRLNRKYGYWGLAYLEAILRRADCMQSRREERHENP